MTGTNGPGNYAVEHLVYAASFSPNLLARYAYYLQFCQGQKSSLTPVPETGSYVAGAAASPMCSLCEGRAPAVCLNTLFFRLRDRFPPVMSTTCPRRSLPPIPSFTSRGSRSQPVRARRVSLTVST